jgi:hypothetical protein
MTTIASCGHRINDNDASYIVTTEEETISEQGWIPCQVTKCICGDCYDEAIEAEETFIDVQMLIPT